MEFYKSLSDPSKGQKHSDFKEIDVPAKVFTWNLLTAGDCQMLPGSKLTIWANGIGLFEATTLTLHTHSGDVWHHFIRVMDNHGTILFTAGTFDGPRMDDGNPPPHYNWQGHFRFDPNFFNLAVQANASFSC
jgi:hypothetical protein